MGGEKLIPEKQAATMAMLDIVMAEMEAPTCSTADLLTATTPDEFALGVRLRFRALGTAVTCRCHAFRGRGGGDENQGRRILSMTVWKDDVKLGVMVAEGLRGPLCWAVSPAAAKAWREAQLE